MCILGDCTRQIGLIHTQTITKPLASSFKFALIIIGIGGVNRKRREEEGAYKKFAVELHGGKSVNIPSLLSRPYSALFSRHPSRAIQSFMAMKTFLLLLHIGKEA